MNFLNDSKVGRNSSVSYLQLYGEMKEKGLDWRGKTMTIRIAKHTLYCNRNGKRYLTDGCKDDNTNEQSDDTAKKINTLGKRNISEKKATEP